MKHYCKSCGGSGYCRAAFRAFWDVKSRGGIGCDCPPFDTSNPPKPHKTVISAAPEQADLFDTKRIEDFLDF